jgi:hypothetical protein
MRLIRLCLTALTIFCLACQPAGRTPDPEPTSAPIETPSTTQPVMPAKPSSSLPLPQAHESFQVESAARKELKDRLWKTPLGRMFSQYLFDPAPPQLALQRAHDLVNRIFSQVTLTLTRMSAVQLMVEDVYEQQLMTPMVHERISLMETSVALKQHAQEADTTTELFKQVPIFILIGLVGGSPLARLQVRAFGRYLANRVMALFGSETALESAGRAEADLVPHLLMSRRVLDDYNVLQAGSTFIQTFGAYSVVFYRFRSGSTDSASIQEKIWIYGMRHMVDLDEL